MKRQGIIYLVGSLGSAAMFTYVVPKCLIAWNRFGLSATFAILMIVAAIFIVLLVLYSSLAFVFLVRAVTELAAAPVGVVLEPDAHARFKSVIVSTPKLVRVVGAQFSWGEAEPKFAVFKAANKFWVTPISRFPPAGGTQ